MQQRELLPQQREPSVQGEQALEILEWMKMWLYEKNPSLIWALGILQPNLEGEAETMGTDGFFLYVNPTWLGEAFLLDGEALCGLFLHVLCHGMLYHPFQYREQVRRGVVFLREGKAQDVLQCGEMEEESIWQQWDQEAWALTEELLGRAKDRNPFVGMDDHHLWGGCGTKASGHTRLWGADGPGEGTVGEGCQTFSQRGMWELVQSRRQGQPQRQNQEQKQRQRWEQAGKAAQRQQEGTGRRAGSRHMSVTQSLTLTSEKRYDYRSFLKGFSRLREEGSLDMEQFDYGFYFWGLRQYGKVPLIEPLEYRETKKIEELVIVIDTSGSCSRELVQMFLEETRNILREEELFFRRFLLHIIQCDNQIQRDDRITSQEELEVYLENLQVTGGGGTDFRPAFARIEELRSQELHRIKGVLYFTDGYGIYPEKMPDYRVAFVFFKHRYDAIDVPDWAEMLVLDAQRPKGAAYEY